MAAKYTFYQKPSCTTCRKAKAFLIEQGIELVSRDLDKDSLSENELENLIGKRDHKDFLNTRNELYRERNMGQHPPNRSEALKLMAKNPNLIRRPLLVHGSNILIGFDEIAYSKLA
jgi:Spx/MgsR family transcriptional regulator